MEPIGLTMGLMSHLSTMEPLRELRIRSYVFRIMSVPSTIERAYPAPERWFVYRDLPVPQDPYHRRQAPPASDSATTADITPEWRFPDETSAFTAMEVVCVGKYFALKKYDLEMGPECRSPEHLAAIGPIRCQQRMPRIIFRTEQAASLKSPIAIIPELAASHLPKILLEHGPMASAQIADRLYGTVPKFGDVQMRTLVRKALLHGYKLQGGYIQPRRRHRLGLEGDSAFIRVGLCIWDVRGRAQRSEQPLDSLMTHSSERHARAVISYLSMRKATAAAQMDISTAPNGDSANASRSMDIGFDIVSDYRPQDAFHTVVDHRQLFRQDHHGGRSHEAPDPETRKDETFTGHRARNCTWSTPDVPIIAQPPLADPQYQAQAMIPEQGRPLKGSLGRGALPGLIESLYLWFFSACPTFSWRAMAV